MEETTVTTSGEVEATSQEVEADSTTTEEVVTSNETETEDTAEASDSTETEGEQEEAKTPNWENSYKELQGAFTRQSQELAELKKQIKAQNEPKYVDDKGKITPEYEQNYRFEVDNREFLTYDNLARRLEPETRAEVERLLGEAKSVYNPKNKTAYNQKMSEIKNYFNADIVEAIALDKRNLESQMQSEFEKLTREHKEQKSKEIALTVEQSEDLKALLYQDSENYSPEMFSIFKQMFDEFGGVDVEVLSKAVSSIKTLGVKEHLAQQKAQAEKQKANVPAGANVVQEAPKLTREYAIANYEKAVSKYGMGKVDEIIMKGN